MSEDVALFDKGWRCWVSKDATCSRLNGFTPADYVEVEMWREGWDEPQLADPSKLDPAVNVADLWWRAAGPLSPRGNRKKQMWNPLP